MIAIKGIEEIPTDCKECPLMGTYGSAKEPLNPMMCIAAWVATHEIKYCIGGRVLDDCPLVEIVTCKDCKYYRNKEDKYSYCTKRLNVDSITDRYREPDYYCAYAERKEK